MKRKLQSARRGAVGDDARSRWATLAKNDVEGIDADIERLIGLYRTKYGYTHEGASAELVRRLSSLDGAHRAATENSPCYS